MRNLPFLAKFIILSLLIGIYHLSLPLISFAKAKVKLNIVLIVLDAVRADHLGCYGYSRDTSPSIDLFSRQSVLFEQAVSQGPCTHIAISSLFTSLYPSVFHDALEWNLILRDKFVALPDILTKHGYNTAVFGGPVLKGISNIEKRFQTASILPRDTQPSLKDGPEPGLEMPQIDSEIAKEASLWLEENHNKPFFLYLHFLASHDPYLPPEPYDTIFWKDEITDKMRASLKNFTRARHHSDEYDKSFDKDMLNFIISQYDGEIRYTDSQVGAILEKLEKLNLTENTLVILTADHGHAFGEHGRFFHDNTLYSELINVPLLMRLPKVLPQDKRVENLVRHIDIMPTVLNILDIHPGSNVMQGISLLPLFRGEVIPKLESVSEVHLGRLKAVRTNGWSFIAHYDTDNYPRLLELYNLKNDPAEVVNLIKKIPDAEISGGAFNEYAEKFSDKLKEYDISCEKLRFAILGTDLADESEVLDEETKEVLRNLGYAQ
ncbi:MAG: sulfatase-like hydrolase/transferase [Candidatus Omnitrophota bacterium]|nr:sulfatase-like hydrolase/transferase [Candidatus Omnitrophota bacterium]